MAELESVQLIKSEAMVQHRANIRTNNTIIIFRDALTRKLYFRLKVKLVAYILTEPSTGF